MLEESIDDIMDIYINNKKGRITKIEGRNEEKIKEKIEYNGEKYYTTKKGFSFFHIHQSNIRCQHH